AIVLAIKTKEVYLSLMSGIWLGWMVLSDWNVLEGSLASIQALVDVFKDAGSTRTIMFGALVGALILFIQRSGGVEGFIIFVQSKLKQIEKKRPGKNKKLILLFTWLTGLLIFVESSISVLTVGALFRPLYDRYKIPREKLAYLADSSSAPSCILIPFNGWGAFIMGLLAGQGFADPFATLVKTIPFNIYPLLALAVALLSIMYGKDIGPMSAAEQRLRDSGKILPDDAQPLISDELTDAKTKAGIAPNLWNMVIPIATMILMMPVLLAYTGWEAAVAEKGGRDFFTKLLFAMGQGSGSTSVLIAVISSLLVSGSWYGSRGMFSMKELMEMTIKGISELMPLALLMLFAFAISNVCKELHTGEYVAGVANEWLSSGLVPLIVFLVSCFIAFSTGTSWGTFAIMIAIAVPMAREMDADMLLTIAAALSGGVFGDHCSPISDTTILSSMAAACDHIDHVRTQLPFALLAGGLSALFYLAAGILG
ncbi:MAG TPA: sodium:solute symporter, partial [Phaeodactylibacter sp.]|nr:sodium:solute symporter [Phaeodactylibacter sp.]